MQVGKVKWFDKKKGYGFISTDEISDIFVHYTSFTGKGLKTLNEGDEVCFEVIAGEKGPRASDVSLKIPDSSHDE